VVKNGLTSVKPLSISVCIPAYNEERTIASVLRHVLDSKQDEHFVIKDVIIVSDSTDRTNDIVEKFEEEGSKVRLIKSRKRLGLSGAITLALENVKSDVVVIVDADVFLEPDCISNLVKPFYDVNIYATSGRKIPISVCSIVHAFWNVHHELCLLHPKLCSSIMAFRNGIVNRIPRFFGTPDTYLMSVLEKRMLKVLYVPDAKGRTLEPNDLRGFIAQRKRIYIQHLFLKRCLGYNPPTFNPQLYVKALVRAILNDRIQRILDYLACALIELFSRLAGLLSFREKWQRSYLWEKVR
jgi:cellulose synthase/poly-beta-1,6-N-acetylglucosamine synthase-like glycosyltransferase